jgi:hypothetical protein
MVDDEEIGVEHLRTPSGLFASSTDHDYDY